MPRLPLPLALALLFGACVEPPDDGPVESAAPVVINELMSAPDAFALGVAGEWIELLNTSDEVVDMDGWQVANARGDVAGVPGGQVIGPRGHRVLLARVDGDEDDAPIIALDLDDSGDSITVRDADGALVDVLDAPALGFAESFGRTPDGADVAARMREPTPGAPNVANADDALCDTIPVRINEVLVLNETGLADESGAPTPWIELYNEAGAHLELGGAQLSVDGGPRWTFPSYLMSPNEYLVVFADGAPDEGPLHTSFAIDEGTTEIALFTECGVGMVPFPHPEPPQPDESYNVIFLENNDPERTAYIFAPPTPGATNFCPPATPCIPEP